LGKEWETEINGEEAGGNRERNLGAPQLEPACRKPIPKKTGEGNTNHRLKTRYHLGKDTLALNEPALKGQEFSKNGQKKGGSLFHPTASSDRKRNPKRHGPTVKWDRLVRRGAHGPAKKNTPGKSLQRGFARNEFPERGGHARKEGRIARIGENPVLLGL